MHYVFLIGAVIKKSVINDNMSSSNEQQSGQGTEQSDSSKEDAHLVELASKGDDAAYARLMEKYQRALYYHILKIVRNREMIEDLIQEVFAKAFQNMDSYNRSYAFSTWLYRIATNHSIDFLRKRKLQTYSLDEPVEGKDGEMHIEPQDPAAETDQPMIQEQRKNLVSEAINQLPEKYRVVIEMRHIQEKSYQEISEEVGQPLGTIKAHLFRARELLNKQLKDKMSQY